MQKSRINWKVAAVSGALVGVGIGGFAIAGAEDPIVLPDGVVLDRSLSASSPGGIPTTTSIPVGADADARPASARGEGPTTTIASPARPDRTSTTIASPASPASVASSSSPASPASIASPPSPASPGSVASPQSSASPASVASPPSPASPGSVGSADSPGSS